MRVMKIVCIILSLCLLTSFIFADVKKQSTQKMDFKGALGTMMKLFGGEKPTQTVEYLKGDMLRSDQLDKKGRLESSMIIDLENELFIQIDHKKKKYTKMTFSEWQEMMKSGMAQLGESTKQAESSADSMAADVKWSFDVDVETPGETEEIAGYTANKVILTLNVEAEATQQDENGESQRAKGGLKVISTNMMTKEIDGSDELKAFQMKMAEKLGMTPGSGGMADMLSQVMKNNEQLAAAMKKMQEESDKLDGVALRRMTTFETWGEQPESQQQEEKKKMPSLGGLFKKMAKKDKDDDGKNVLLETTMEVSEYNTSAISDDVFEVPEKYKEEKYKKK